MTIELDYFFNLSLDMLCIAGMDGYFKRLNPAFEKTLGFSQAELLDKPFIDFIHPDDRAKTRVEIEKLVSGNLAVEYEVRFQAKDGGYRWLSWNARSVPEEGVMYAVARDMTERRRTGEDLQQLNTILATQQEASPDGILIVDKGGQWVSFNQKFVELWEIPLEITRNGVSQQALQSVKSKLANPTRFLDKVTYLYKNPTETSFDEVELIDGRTFDRYSAPTIGADGTFFGRVWHYRDITERKQSEAALLSSENRLQAILDNVVDGIITINEQGIVRSFNPAAEQIFGRTAAEIIDRNINTLMPEPYRSKHDTYLSNYLHTGQAQIIGIGREVIGRRKDGSTFPMELAVSELWVGEERLFTGIVRDITERKQAEEERQRILQELESANQELTDFAYVVSHDLKAPLRAIGSLTSWLSTDYAPHFDDEGRELIDLIMGRVKRMEGLIDGVLQYSRIGRVKEEMTEVDLQQLVPEIIDFIAPPDHIKIKIKADLPSVWAEPTRIGQVFQNLLSNAVKFMDKPQGQIAVDCKSQDSQWQFSVSDNGPGIDEKHFDKIFQIFQTLTARDEFESSGIGLSIINKIVEMYGGQVWVKSEVGLGTTFYFTLPKDRQHNSRPLGPG